MQKTNKKKITLAITIALIAIVVLAIVFSSSLIDKASYTTEFGSQAIEASSCNFICKLLNPTEQTVYFSTSEYSSSSIAAQPVYKTDQTITQISYASCEDYTNNLANQDVVITIYTEDINKGTLYYKTIKLYNQKNHVTLKTSVTNIFEVVGSWKTWDKITCYKPGTTTQTYTQEYKTYARKFTTVATTTTPTTTTCASAKQTGQISYSSSSDYKNVKQFDCELWTKETLTNGVCVKSEYDKNCKTICLSGSYCDNSYSSTTCSGQVSCVKQSCPSGTTGTYPNCITPAITPAPSATPTPTETPSETPTPSMTITPIPQATVTPTETPTTTGTPTTTETQVGTTNTVFAWIIVIILGIIIVAIIYKIVRDRRKGRKKK